MSTDANKAIARRYFEDIWNKRNPDAVGEIFAATFAGHAPDGTLQGAEALKKRVKTGLSEYLDIHFTIEDVIAEEDKVGIRWVYHATAKSKPVTLTGMHFFRIAGGKIVEFWLNTDEPKA